MPQKKAAPKKPAAKRDGRAVRPNTATELNPISVWKLTPNTRMYGLSVFQHKTRAFTVIEREFTGAQIDAIRAWLKKQKVKLSLDGDWKPFLRGIGVSI